MGYQRVIVQHSGKWEKSNYVGGEDQVVHIPDEQLSYDLLLNEIYEFMEASPLNVKYTLHYLIKADDGRPLKGLLKTDADLARLCIEIRQPVVYVTEKIVIHVAPNVDVGPSSAHNERYLGDDFIDDEPSAEDSEAEDDNYESELRQNQIAEFCEWIRAPGHLDEFVNIIENGGPLNFSSEKSSNVATAPNFESLLPTRWEIPVAHVHDLNEEIEYDPPGADVGALEVGSTFLSKEELTIVVGKWHMQHRVEYSIPRSNKSPVEFSCKHRDECSFRIYASEKYGLWKVKKCDMLHTCQTDLTRNAPRKLSSKVIAEHFSKRLVHEGSILKPREMIAELLRDYGVEIEYGVALRARNLAVNGTYGDHDQSYQVLPTYLHMLKLSNPGTMYDIATTSDGRFKYMFLAMGVQRTAFSLCMRPVVVVDGTHLKGKNTGILFVAVTKDGEEHCYPLAIGIGPIENDASWTWFLSHFRDAFGDREGLLIVSDAHPSIKNAVQRVYPNAAHGLCYYHMAKNLARYGSHFAAIFKFAMYAYTNEVFQRYMTMMQEEPSAYNHLIDIGVHRWARTQCPVRRYSFMTSNMAESFNSRLLWARRLPICSMIEVVRDVIENWFNQRRELAMARDHILTKIVYEKLNPQSEIGRKLKVQRTGAHIHTVRMDSRSYTVDLHQKTCDCGRFQLDQIPCSHAAAAIRRVGHNVYDYVEFYYKQATLVLAYHDRVCPLPPSHEWTTLGDCVCPLPPISVPQAGRPRGGRYRSPVEGLRNRRRQLCSRCGAYGHNKSKCIAPLTTESSSGVTNNERQRAPKKCSICRNPNHTKVNCPSRDVGS